MTHWCTVNILLNKFYVYDLKVSEGVGGMGMVQRKILVQYLTSGEVSTRSS